MSGILMGTMRKLRLCCLGILFASSVWCDSLQQISCERIEIYNWHAAGMQLTCFMTESVEINSSDFTISSERNEKIGGLDFTYNTKVYFLPIAIDTTFPDLVGYDASFCSLTELSKDNFKNLVKLTTLWLNNNKIEKILSETFQDLIALEFLALDGNKIKFLNGKAFSGLSRLIYISLYKNECIGSVTHIKNSVERGKFISERCGFEESDNKISETPILIHTIEHTSTVHLKTITVQPKTAVNLSNTSTDRPETLLDTDTSLPDTTALMPDTSPNTTTLLPDTTTLVPDTLTHTTTLFPDTSLDTSALLSETITLHPNHTMVHSVNGTEFEDVHDYAL